MKKQAVGRISDRVSAVGISKAPAYIIRGDEKSLLVDAGVSVAGPLYLKGVEDYLKSIHDLDYIFITHSHWDHLGALKYLKDMIPTVQIGAFHTVDRLLKKGKVISQIVQFNRALKDMFPDMGTGEDHDFDTVDIDIPLKGGEVFDLGGVTCEILSTPGHTKDSISFFIPEEGILFPGEAVGVPEGDDFGEVQVEFLSSYSEYIKAIDLLTTLKPEIICMAHDAVFTDEDASGYLVKSHEATVSYKVLIENYIKEAGRDIDRAVEIMVQKEYDEKGGIGQPRFAYLINATQQVKHIASMQKAHN